MLGFDNLADYLGEQHIHHFGTTVGRTASRIKDAEFSIGDTKYHLSKNDGNNHYDGTDAEVNIDG